MAYVYIYICIFIPLHLVQITFSLEGFATGVGVDELKERRGKEASGNAALGTPLAGEGTCAPTPKRSSHAGAQRCEV